MISKEDSKCKQKFACLKMIPFCSHVFQRDVYSVRHIKLKEKLGLTKFRKENWIKMVLNL